MTEPLAVEAVRSGVVESVHLADCAVIDAAGAVRAAAGEPATVAYLRSAAKPLQARVCIDEGWTPPGEPHLAVACGSHSGEAAHRAAVAEILAAGGVTEEALRCPPARPLGGEGPDAPIAHNCSGKHAAMLATAAARGWPLDGYLDPEHPLQRAVRDRIVAWAAAPLGTGVDGCGAPTFAAPLAAIARAFSALGTEELRGVAAAMRAHPFHVAGTGRVCTALIEAVPGLVAKVGAEGVGCLLLPGGAAAAFKVRDGSARAREALMVAVLVLLGVLPEPLPERLRPFARPAITGGGRPVGELRVRGRLL